jgi:predicted flap endonuclease-1-like 5' DNA nuclease
MFGQWLKFWRQCMFWWLPGGDEPEKTTPAQEPKEPATRATTNTEAADLDAATTWRPEPDAQKPLETEVDDLTSIHGVGPAIARKLDALGIKTFADLAAADPDDLTAKIAKRPVTSARVREWIAEAKKRAS